MARRPRPRPSAWRHFVSWNRDPNFWRDVYSRAVSTIIVAVLVYIGALVGGYTSVHRSDVALIVFALLSGAIGVVRYDRTAFNWLERLDARYPRIPGRWILGRGWRYRALRNIFAAADVFVFLVAIPGVAWLAITYVGR